MKPPFVSWACGASVYGSLLGVFLCTLCVVAEEAVHEDKAPPGHFLPLGFHREPEPPFDERHALLSSREFFEEFSLPGKPVVFRKVFSDHPALKKWQDDEYLRTEHGRLSVLIEVGKKENRDQPGRMETMEEFLNIYQTTDDYLADTMPNEMKNEWFLPSIIHCGGYVENLVDVRLWFSSGGTSSVLHTDMSDNFHCVVDGVKQFVMIDARFTDHIGMDHKEGGYFGMDVDRVDMMKYNMTGVPWWNVTINAGDCLFIPYLWIHQVRSYKRNIGINLWWMPIRRFVDTCHNDLALADAPLHEDKMLQHIISEAAGQDQRATAEELALFFKERVPRSDVFAQKMMALLDKHKKGWVAVDEITEPFFREVREEMGRIQMEHMEPIEGYASGEETADIADDAVHAGEAVENINDFSSLPTGGSVIEDGAERLTLEEGGAAEAGGSEDTWSHHKPRTDL